MSEYLPEIYRRFLSDQPNVMTAYEALADATHAAGPLTDRERRLVKIAIAIGAQAEGAVRSHARKARAEGIEEAALGTRRSSRSRPPDIPQRWPRTAG